MNTPRSQAPPGPIHMVDLQGLHARLRPELNRAMDEVLQESAFIRGRHVSAFEAKLSATLQLDAHVVGCGNGTDALYLALRALGVGPGDEVIVPDFSFIATAEVVAEVGAIPVFADIDPRTFNLDPASAERARSARTKAVIVVHLFGQCADMDALVPWAQTHGLHLVEDNAQSLGATYCGATVQGPAGTLGDVGCTSFFPSKNLGALGDGGAVMARNADLAARARTRRQPRRRAQVPPPRGRHQLPPRRPSSGLPQRQTRPLPRPDCAASSCRRPVRRDVGGHAVATPHRDPHSSHVFHQYCVMLPAGCDRSAVQNALKEQGIPTAVYYPGALSAQPAMAQLGRVAEGGTPVSQDAAARILALPMHTELTEDIQAFVVEQLSRTLKADEPPLSLESTHKN